MLRIDNPFTATMLPNDSLLVYHVKLIVTLKII